MAKYQTFALVEASTVLQQERVVVHESAPEFNYIQATPLFCFGEHA